MFRKFRQLCSRAGSLLALHIVLEGSNTIEQPVSSGKFGDVWEGIYNGNRVAIQTLPAYKGSDVREVREVNSSEIFNMALANFHHKLFCGEALLWRGISHPNIVPFLGILEAQASLSMVSEWMPKENVRAYVVNDPEVSRLQLVCPPENEPAPR